MGCWRKSGNNYVKGTQVLNIGNKYKVNKLIGHEVILYDFSKFVNIPKGKKLKTNQTKAEAINWRIKYMKEHNTC